MDERLRFVARLLDGDSMTDVCRGFGISRKTGYKIFTRYKDQGVEALCDRSRRPVRYANQLPPQIAPSMALSWSAGKPVATERSDTIAEGIEVRVPVPESVARLLVLVDDMVLVDDSELLDAMQLAAQTLGLLLEPSAAAGLAAIRVCDLPGDRLATVLTGSNLRPEHLRALIKTRLGGEVP